MINAVLRSAYHMRKRNGFKVWGKKQFEDNCIHMNDCLTRKKEIPDHKEKIQEVAFIRLH